MGRIYVYPWDQLSEGASAIAKALGTQKLLRKKSRYTPTDGDVIVNWGASDIGKWLEENVKGKGVGVRILNPVVDGALDKLVFFRRTAGNPYVPQYFQDKESAKTMKFPVVCRTKTKGMDGVGIVISDSEAELVEAKLYVEMMPKTAEYRVHVGRDAEKKASIIGVQRKFLSNRFAGDKRLRIGNDCYFVWTVKGKEIIDEMPDQVKEAALSVFGMFPELTFGGLDVIYNHSVDPQMRSAYVLEINSAPAQTDRSAKMYADLFEQYRNPVAKVEPKPVAVVAYAPPVGPIQRAWEVFVGDRPLYEITQREAFEAGFRANQELEAQVRLAMYAMVGDPQRIDVV